MTRRLAAAPPAGMLIGSDVDWRSQLRVGCVGVLVGRGEGGATGSFSKNGLCGRQRLCSAWL